jgi:WD40 repeat protein
MVWDLAQAQELRPILTERSAALPQIAFAPGGDRLAVARAAGTLSIVDVRTGATSCAAPAGPPIKQLVWIGGDELAVLRSNASSVELWSARRCAVAATLEHPGPITAMATRAGSRLATAVGDVVRVWNQGRLEAAFTGYAGKLEKVGVDGDDVYAITDEPTAIVVDTIGAPGHRRTFHIGGKGTGAKTIPEVLFDHERGRVIAPSRDQFLYVWDAATGALVHKLQGTGPLTGVRMSPDGSIMIGVGGISPAIWDRATGAPRGRLEGHTDLVKDGDFIDREIFVSIAGNHTALVWDMVASRPIAKFHDVEAIAFADDRRTVALVGATGVRLWSPRTPVPELGALPAPPPES